MASDICIETDAKAFLASNGAKPHQVYGRSQHRIATQDSYTEIFIFIKMNSLACAPTEQSKQRLQECGLLIEHGIVDIHEYSA